MIKTGIGQDSHRFEAEPTGKKLFLGGLAIPGCPGLAGNSDADVVLHALTNAISGITGVTILGAVADDLCLNQGITDSRVYLRKSLEHLEGFRVAHASISIEAQRPKLAPHIPGMKNRIAEILGLADADIGITATTGEGLTAFGRSEGIQAFAVVTAERV